MAIVDDDYADEILDDALDEFEDDLDGNEVMSSEEAIKSSVKAVMDAPPTIGGDGQTDDISAAMGKLMEEMKNPDFASTLEDTFKQLAAGGPASGVANPFAGKGPGPNGIGRNWERLGGNRFGGSRGNG